MLPSFIPVSDTPTVPIVYDSPEWVLDYYIITAKLNWWNETKSVIDADGVILGTVEYEDR